MDYIVSALRQNPELAIFLTVAIGFLIGRVRFGSFSLGIVVGCLLAGVLVGQLDIKVSPLVKTVFFDLFLFTTGYKVGPQFFRGLKSDALPQMALTVVLCVTCLLVAFGFSKLLGYDIGTAAGLLAGAFSESTVIGTAGDAIQRLTIPEADKAALINNIPVAYAVTYLVGTATLVWFIPTIGPKLMGVNLRDEGARMRGHADGDGQAGDGVMSAARTFDLRAYRVTNPHSIGRTIAEIEALPKGVRAFVLRVRSGEQHPRGDTRPGHSKERRRGDRRPARGARGKRGCRRARGQRPRPARHTGRGGGCGGDQSSRCRQDARRPGRGVVRTWHLPVEAHPIRDRTADVRSRTRIDRGDVMHLVGPVPELALAAEALGYADRRTSATDMVFVGLGIFLGGLVGLLSVVVWGVPLTLTASGGALVMGLVFGWLRSVYPLFGRIPEPAIWIFDTLGLCMFIAIVGLTAGPSFISGLQTTGLSLVAVGLVSALLPHTVGILFGRYVLRMEPLIVLGACAGAGTITAALRAVQDEARSSIPALGYTVPYAIGNILLTAWGPVLVAMMSL